MGDSLNRLRYRTGQVILAGDVVEYFGERGYVEFVVNDPVSDSQFDWYLETLGPRRDGC
jgi:hypothetical protein